MADVRALLRQQREARRITHPYASYSAAGKLVCTLCREAVKADSLWGSHVRGKDHRERARREQDQTGGDAKAAVEEADAEEKGGEHSVPSAPDASVAGPRPLKRKLEEDGHIDVNVDHVDHDNGSGTTTTTTDDAARRKRSKADNNMETPPLTGTIPPSSSSSSNAATGAADKYRRDQNLTPPSAGGGVGGIGWRRSSGTPSAGMEINIPSRPATPAAHRGEGGSSSSTPTAGVAMTLPMAKKADGGGAGMAAAAEAMAAANPDAATATAMQTPTDKSVDEAEWAAFEADIDALDQPNGQGGGAVVSAPPMTAEESAAAAAAVTAAAASAAENGEEGGEKVGFARDREILDEREDATRALEEEFDDMEALEARVRILKERREALRKLSEAAGAGRQDPGDNEKNNPGYAERMTEQADGGDEEEDDDDEDDEEDGWASFRFQA